MSLEDKVWDQHIIFDRSGVYHPMTYPLGPDERRLREAFSITVVGEGDETKYRFADNGMLAFIERGGTKIRLVAANSLLSQSYRQEAAYTEFDPADGEHVLLILDFPSYNRIPIHDGRLRNLPRVLMAWMDKRKVSNGIKELVSQLNQGTFKLYGASIPEEKGIDYALIAIDPFGFPPEALQEGVAQAEYVKEYLNGLEFVLGQSDRNRVRPILMEPEISADLPYSTEQRDRFQRIRNLFGGNVIKYSLIIAPEAPMANVTYRQSGKFPLKDVRQAYIIGTNPDEDMRVVAKILRKKWKNIALYLVYDQTLQSEVPTKKPEELKEFYENRGVPVEIVLSDDLPFVSKICL